MVYLHAKAIKPWIHRDQAANCAYSYKRQKKKDPNPVNLMKLQRPHRP